VYSSSKTPDSSRGGLQMRMILPKQLVNEINTVINKLENIAQSNETTGTTSDYLDDLCKKLDELANSYNN
jgi:hypothetical protein